MRPAADAAGAGRRPARRPCADPRRRPTTCGAGGGRTGWPRLAAAGARGADPDQWWGLRRALRRPRRCATTTSRSGCQPVQGRDRSGGASCAGCSSTSAAATPPAPRRASAPSCTPSPRPRSTPELSTDEALRARLDALLPTVDLGRGWVGAQGAREGRRTWCAGSRAGSPPTGASWSATELEFAGRGRPGPARRPGRPAGARRRGPGGGRRPQDRHQQGAGRRAAASTRSSPPTSWRSRRARSPTGRHRERRRRAGPGRQGGATKDVASSARRRWPSDDDPDWARELVPRWPRAWPARRSRRSTTDYCAMLPGAHQLPGAGRRPAGDRMSPARTRRDQPTPVRRRRRRPAGAARRRPSSRSGSASRTRRRRAGRGDRRAAAPARRRRRRRLGQDRDDGPAGGLAGRQRAGRAGPGPRPDVHPQGRGRARRAGPPDAARGCGTPTTRSPFLTDEVAAALRTGEPTVSTYHSYAARAGRRARAAGRARAEHAADRRGGVAGSSPPQVVESLRRRHGRRRPAPSPRSPATCSPWPASWPSTCASPTTCVALTDAGPRAPARRCRGRRASAAGQYTDVTRPARQLEARLALLPLVARTPRASATRGAMDYGDQVAVAARIARGAPRGRRDRARPVRGGAARRVPGHQRGPAGAAHARCSAAATR